MTDAFAPLDDSPRRLPDPDKDGDCVMPAPAGSPAPAMRHPTLGTPVRSWEYRDAAGALLGVAARFEHNGEKDIRYWTLWRRDGRLKWRCKHWPRPKPLYGLDRLAARPGVPVVICEGEKATDAAAILLPDHVAMCWPGGANAPHVARWDALVDRDVILWPDNDQPGWKAMAAVASILKSVRARRVRLVNRELLATRVPLEKGDDASDLIDSHGWTPVDMAAFLALPDALIDAPSGEKSDGDDYRAMVDALEKHLAAQSLMVDATERWRRDGKHARLVNSAIIAKDFAYQYRFNGKVPTTIAVEVVEHLARCQAAVALEAIKVKLIGRPVTDSGQIALARWIYAVTGEQSEEVLWAMLHWLWLVKRSLAGLPRAHDIMPILYGTCQGSGKSTAVARLVSPWLELSEPINAELLTENKRAPELERFAIGVWDEMEGAAKADIEALKNTVTCETKSYRPMATNSVAHVHRMMCFIGTSNKPVESMVRDTTGARRFFQIDCQATIDWQTVNTIDYTSLWSAISEHDASPLEAIDIRDAVRDWQGRSRGRDNVSEWVAAEGWDWFDWQPASGVPTRRVPAYQADVGDSVQDIRARYFRWCRESGEQPISVNLFGQRLKQEGFDYRLVWSMRNQRRYFRPSTPLAPPEQG